MIIKILPLVIFLITFTPINTTPCQENPYCECSSPNNDEFNVFCNFYDNTGFTMNIKSRKKIQILCKNWKGWENFYFRASRSDNILESLSFEKCGLPNDVRIKDLVKQLGVFETETLIFKSFHNLYKSLTRFHLEKLKNLKSLTLVDNGLIYIPNDLLLDCPALEFLDLSDNNFELPVDIFNVTTKLKQIELVSSGIDTIYDGTFNKLKNLESLNMMSNFLEEIKPDTFDQLVSLTSLNLANNLLSDLPQTVFHELKNLEKLDISMNHFSSIPSELFVKNKQLKELYLHGNIKKLNTLPDNLLANLTMLSKVHLNNNGFTFLPENLFWNSSPLHYIYLNDNSLVTLPKNIFRDLKNVKHLFLNNNKFSTLSDRIFEDLQDLETLDLSNNLFISLSRDLFFGLDYLHELNMERNQLHFIHRMSFFTLTNLKIAKFSHNPLNLIHKSQKLSVFYTNQYLEELYLSNCSIDSFFDDWTSGNNNLKLLDLSNNSITHVTENLFMLPSNEIMVDLSYNKIKRINLHKMELMASWSRETRKVDIILNHNPLLCDCPFYDVLRYREREMSPSVYDRYNIRTENLTCVQPNRMNEIKISNLNTSTYECLEHELFKTEKLCQDNCICNARPSDKTRILDCSYKNMAELFIDKEKVMFEIDSPLIINLTGNFLTEIPSTEALYPIKITHFLLSNNNISTITIDKLPSSLKVLELHNNNISSINIEIISFVATTSLEEFTIRENPFTCDCINQNLIYFVKSYRSTYEDLNNLICKETQLPMYQQKNVDKLCPPWPVLAIMLGIVIGIMIGCISSAIYHKEKFKLWYKHKITEYSNYFIGMIRRMNRKKSLRNRSTFENK